jgi:hypothetical protein
MSLINSLNWNIGVRMTIRGTKQDNGQYLFKRIRHTVPATTRILVAVGTSNAKPTWKYGGQCRIILPHSPSSTTKFLGGIVVAEKNLPIARLELFDLSYLDADIYAVEIIPPTWFSDVYLESWWYDGDAVGLEKSIKDLSTNL